MNQWLISLAVFFMFFIFRNSIKSLIGQFFSNLSEKQIQVFFILLILMALSLSLLILDDVDTPTQEKEVVLKENKQDLEDEMIRKGVDVAEEIVRGEIAKKKVRDSIRSVTKKEWWAYAIGIPSRRKDQVLWDSYSQLKDVKNVYAFEIERNLYILVKYDHLDKTVVQENYTDFKTQFNHITSKIDIVDLMKYCKLKEDIVKSKPITWRKSKGEIPCLTCN